MPRTIVGVSADIRAGVLHDFVPIVFMPSAQMPSGSSNQTFIVHAHAANDTIANAVTAAIQRIDADLPQPWTNELSEFVAYNLQAQQSVSVILAVLGAIALALALGGVFGVIAYGVALRNHEIGIRLALGASPRVVTMALLRGSILPSVIGVTLGVPLAALGANALDGTLIEQRLLGPLEEVALVAFVIICVAVAAYLPARRAARVDPLIALRYE